MTGIALSKDGEGPGQWRVWAIHEDGTKTLLTEVREWPVKEPQVVEVERIDPNTKKPRKEKRHIDVVVGTKQVCGEGQTAALARAIGELKKQIDDANRVPVRHQPGNPVQTKHRAPEEHNAWAGMGGKP